MHILSQINLQKIDTSSVLQKYLLCFEDRYFEINEQLFFLINDLKTNDYNIVESTKCYNNKYNKKHNYIEIENLLHIEIKKITSKDNSSLNSSFKLKKSIISSKKIDFITNSVKFLFSKKIFFSLNLSSFILIGLFFNINDFTNVFNVSNILISSFIIFLSVIFHEIGHATACKYYGINHGDIGFALYLYFPVFYADVSNAWTLERKKRLVINYAGIYFQLIFLIPIFLYHFYSGNSLSALIIYSILASFLFDLNPFFKFDGYWIASDLLGVPNLRERTNEVLIFYINKFTKNKKVKTPYFFAINQKSKWMFLIYFILMNAFFSYIFFFKIPKYLIVQIEYFINLNYNLMYFQNFSIFLSLIINLFFLIIFIYFLKNTFYKFLNFLKSWQN